MEEMFDNFIWVTKLLNAKGIIPVLYGSLGLYQIIKPLGEVDDIDFLLPNVWLSDRWPEIKLYLENNGFTMDDEHEHEFSHPDINGFVAFGSLEESRKHSGLKAKELRKVESNGAHYFTLNAKQYLAAYQASLADSYRQERKGNADILKIEAIKSHLRSDR